jgi:hypothetical protein
VARASQVRISSPILTSADPLDVPAPDPVPQPTLT